ncbi:MAG: redoxin family protein [Nitrospiraceae bacterium]
MNRPLFRFWPGMFAALALLASASCGTPDRLPGSEFTYKVMPVANGTINAGEGNNVLSQGKPLMLSGKGTKIGAKLHDVKLTQIDLALVSITDTKGKGKVRIISVVPSIDKEMYGQQTHYLSEKNKGLDKIVELITISIDTPFAQRRFAEEAKITNVTFLSDYRGADFGKAHGLYLKDPHILTQAVMVVDAANIVRYLQVTPELAQLADMDEAFRFARTLVTAS